MTDRLPELPAKELDALLDHIYEHGTAAEGVRRLAQAFALAAYRAGMLQAAQIADAKAVRLFPWGSENSDTYHAQADWAQHIAAAIRRAAEGGAAP